MAWIHITYVLHELHSVVSLSSPQHHGTYLASGTSTLQDAQSTHAYATLKSKEESQRCHNARYGQKPVSVSWQQRRLIRRDCSEALRRHYTVETICTSVLPDHRPYSINRTHYSQNFRRIPRVHKA